MGKILRMILAFVLGVVIGIAVNMGLITAGGALIPPPAGADVSTMEGLAAALPFFGPQHFVFPFLAHALGTLAGALVAGLLAPDRSPRPAYVVGAFFLLGGVANIFMLPGPAWFNAVDVILAYVPMAWVGQKAAVHLRADRTQPSGT